MEILKDVSASLIVTTITGTVGLIYAMIKIIVTQRLKLLDKDIHETRDKVEEFAQDLDNINKFWREYELKMANIEQLVDLHDEKIVKIEDNIKEIDKRIVNLEVFKQVQEQKK